MPIEDSATPIRSNEWLCVSSRGTSRQASTRPTRPIGTLMKKIHCQPGPSTSRPPTSGPTRVATPAVAPQNDMAWPRCPAGKVRVMTAIVCGVISDAPRPWTTRATTSSVIEPVSPHHREAAVNRASPTR